MIRSATRQWPRLPDETMRPTDVLRHSEHDVNNERVESDSGAFSNSSARIPLTWETVQLP